MLGNKIRSPINNGDVKTLRAELHRNSDLANRPISWGMGCRTDPLHYLSDGFFNNLWEHELEGVMAKVLLDSGARVNGSPDAGETPLHGAASLGCTNVARVLIDNGANLESKAEYPDIPDGTPLDYAIHFGMVEVVDLLVQSGAKVISPRMCAGIGDVTAIKDWLSNSETNDTAAVKDAFRCAAVCGRCDVVDLFLELGVNVNDLVNKGTALHWASWEAKPEMVSHLLAKGADHRLRDPKYNMTPSEWAKHRLSKVGPRWGHHEVIRVLDIA
jgi:hypothetical protein